MPKEGRSCRNANCLWRTIALGILVVASGCAGLSRPPVQPVSHVENENQTGAASISEKVASGSLDRSPPTATEISYSDVWKEPSTPEELPSPQTLPITEQPGPDRHPIDLATALQLAGADNLQIALASERIRQAQARLEGAEYQWLPSLNVGVGYNLHDGRVQGTDGEVIDTSRNALFIGGGPNVGPAPLTGPGGPGPRLFLGLPLADVLFAPLAKRQQAQAAGAASATTFNDALLQVSLAYLELLQSEGRVAIAQQAITNAEELDRLVESRVRAGNAPPADELRTKIDGKQSPEYSEESLDSVLYYRGGNRIEEQ